MAQHTSALDELKIGATFETTFFSNPKKEITRARLLKVTLYLFEFFLSVRDSNKVSIIQYSRILRSKSSRNT